MQPGANLVELECVEELVQLPVFADLLELHVVLLETMQRELRLIVDEDLERLQGLSETGTSSEAVEPTLAMNFLHVIRMSLARVALNIMTCLWCGVARKISWTSRLMSGGTVAEMVR